MGPQYGRATMVGDVTDDIANVVSAIAEITNNGANLSALTFDSFSRKMGRAYGWSDAQVRSAISVAWMIIPEKYRTRLQRRESASAPTPVTPPVTAPVTPSAHFPEGGAKKIPWGWIFAGLGVLAAGGAVVYKLGKRK